MRITTDAWTLRHELQALVFALQFGSCCGRSFSGACRCVASKCHSQRSRQGRNQDVLCMVIIYMSVQHGGGVQKNWCQWWRHYSLWWASWQIELLYFACLCSSHFPRSGDTFFPFFSTVRHFPTYPSAAYNVLRSACLKMQSVHSLICVSSRTCVCGLSNHYVPCSTEAYGPA